MTGILNAQLHAEADLAARHTVTSLARVAGMSPFHFQRVFKRVTGETVGNQLRRLRLERAAFLIKRSNAPLSEIAEVCGFATPSGFSRAFSRLFGVAPQTFASRVEITPFLRLQSAELNLHPKPLDEQKLARCPLTVRIEEVPDQTAIVRRFVGPTQKMPTVWPAFKDQLREAGISTDDASYIGIHSDDWELPSADLYRYDAGAIVAKDEIPSELPTVQLPRGLVAMTAFNGSLLSLDRTWHLFVNEWLPASGWQFRTTFVFDQYRAELINSSRLKQIVRLLTGIQATLCIPVEPAESTPTIHSDSSQVSTFRQAAHFTTR